MHITANYVTTNKRMSYVPVPLPSAPATKVNKTKRRVFNICEICVRFREFRLNSSFSVFLTPDLTMEMESEETDHGISYEKAAEYWSDIPPTIDGMLGGFAKISGTDIDGSSKFLKGLFRLDDAPGNSRCLDCGAGIGRISKHLLQRHFSTVDLVEQNPKFLEQVRYQKFGNLDRIILSFWILILCRMYYLLNFNTLD